MLSSRHWSTLLGCGMFVACGQTVAERNASTDAGPNEPAQSDAAAAIVENCPGTSRCPPIDGGLVGQCTEKDGPDTSPFGNACVWSRIVTARSPGTCAPVGTWCDDLYFSYYSNVPDAGPAIPAEFVCGRAELGVTNCAVAREAGGAFELHAALLEAACRVTAALPNVSVVCEVYL